MLLKSSAGRTSGVVARCKSATSRVPHVAVRATLNTTPSKPAVAKFADSIGLPTDEGLFGFKPFSEVWCGRLAMMGFVCSIVEEFVTGRGTLGQLGLETPSVPLLVVLSVFFGGATVLGTVNTVNKLISKKMTRREVDRYKSFLGLSTKDENLTMKAVQDMKKRGDFTSLGNDLNAIAEAKKQGSPVDAFLSTNEIAEADKAGREMKSKSGLLTISKAEEAQDVAVAESAMKTSSSSGPSVSLAAKADVEEQLFFNDELKYARDIELSNGRSAMVGFLAAVLVEAATGKGIILQLIMYFKLVGLLGVESGF